MNLYCRAVVSLTVVLLIMGAAGCAPPAAVGTAVQSATRALPTVTPSPPPAETPTPTITSTITPTPFIPKATIKIASQGPLSGNFLAAGTGLRRGADLAIRQLAGPLMELGYKVELAAYDDQNDVRVAVDNAKKLVEDPDILCGVGHYTSRVYIQAKEIYHQAGLAFIAPSTTSSTIAKSQYLEVNRVIGRNDVEGAAGARFAKAQGFARPYVISESGGIANLMARNFREEANRLDLIVVSSTTTDSADNFGKLIDSILKSEADLVYFGTFRKDQAGTFFREARAAGYLGAFMGPSSLSDPALLDLAGPSLIDGGGMYYTDVVANASDYPDAADFLDAYKDQYGIAPQPFTAQAYDAAGVCMKAIEVASRAKGGNLPSRAEVAIAIRALVDYKGITGTFNFDRNGDPNPARYFVYQVVLNDPKTWGENHLVASLEVAPP